MKPRNSKSAPSHSRPTISSANIVCSCCVGGGVPGDSRIHEHGGHAVRVVLGAGLCYLTCAPAAHVNQSECRATRAWRGHGARGQSGCPQGAGSFMDLGSLIDRMPFKVDATEPRGGAVSLPATGSAASAPASVSLTE